VESCRCSKILERPAESFNGRRFIRNGVIYESAKRERWRGAEMVRYFDYPDNM